MNLPRDVDAPHHIYKHHKGGMYRLLFLARESTNGRPRETLVVYVSLLKGHVNVRRHLEFFEDVEWPDGVRRPRFVRVGGGTEGLVR